MHRKLWARLLSCYVALTMVFARVPVQAFAEDLEHPDQDSVEYADGALYYSNSQWSYNCLRNDGYGVEGYPTWDDFNAQTRQAILESMAWQEFILLYGGYNPMRGQWVWTRPSDAIASQMRDYLQEIVDSTSEIKPYQPGGIGGGSGDSGGGDEPSNPGPSDDYGFYPDGDGYSLYVSHIERSSTKSFAVYDSRDSSSYVLIPWVSMPSVMKIHVKAGFRDWIVKQIPSAGSNIGIAIQDFGSSSTEVSDLFDCILTNTSNTYVVKTTNDSVNVGVNGSGKMYYLGGYDGKFAYQDGEIVYFVDRVPSGNFSYSRTVPMTFNSPTYYFGAVLGTDLNPWPDDGGGTGGTVNPVPDPSTIEKPESPATPSNPQTPERDSPTIVIGGTTQTVPDPSPAPDLSTIEELLRRILANTNTIIEQMNSFASQLGQELADFYDAVYDWFGVIDTRLRDQIALLDSEIEWLEGIFDWTKSIDTDVQYLQSVCSNGFDNVVGVLRRILERMTLAGDSGGSKPGIVDPADPSPVMDWLRQLWTSFLADLQMVLPDQVGAVVDFLDQLRQKFPFSIPWDIAAMLALLNHAPVTPVIDIPWGYAGGIEYVHVDCHAWDDAVEIVRPMFLLLFALCLALLTRDLLAGLEAVL